MFCGTHYQFLVDFYIKLTMGTSVIAANLLRMKSDFVFVRLVNLKSDFSLKLNEGLDKFIPIRMLAFWM